MEKVDLVIIGAGVVGCATARQAALDFPGRNIIVLEKNDLYGLEASARNSGVLHSGFHHRAGSLKEMLANKGSKLAKDYARKNNIKLLESGMLIVVSGIHSLSDIFKNVDLLKNMYANSRRQNLKFLILSRWGVRKLEPNVKAAAGIFLPEIAIIDSVNFVRTMFSEATFKQVDFLFNTAVRSIRVCKNDPKYGKGIIINDSIIAKAVVNCAGIHSDEIASMFGIHYQQYPVRGEYYQIVGPKQNIVSRLVSPAVPPGNSSKGILFSPRPNRRLFLGPSFKPVKSKTDYENDRTPPEIFIESVKNFMPDLTVDDLEWSYSGIRAKLGLSGDQDFVIKLDMTDPPLVNNIGVDSPGLSSAMAIAEMNCQLLKHYC